MKLESHRKAGLGAAGVCRYHAMHVLPFCHTAGALLPLCRCAGTYASPESWVRGSAALSLGWLSLTLELETDLPQAGPKGRLYVTLSKGCLHPVHGACDAVHDPLVDLYTVETDEVGIGGRSRGGDTGIIRRSASVDIPDNLARQVTHVAVKAECTGSGTQWSGWTSLQDAENAFEAAGRPAGSSQLE